VLQKEYQNIKALVMFSGGLDSSLVIRILQEQGIGVEAFHYTGAFHAGQFDGYDSSAKCFADSFGVKLSTFKIGDDFVDVLKNPRYGYGSNMNPCIDCRIYTLKKAKEYMGKIGAAFIATGEVLGQRPMSQRKNMLKLIEKHSGLEGLLLRPLSAKLLEPTIPEEKGWVDREKLFDISGRSRKAQIALAEKYGIKDYPNPAGGCLLTDPQFSVRVRDLLKHDNLTIDEIEFLKVGRHFRLSKDTKVIVGRDQDDNARILELVKEDNIILRLKDMPGPVAILKGRPTDKDIELAGAITARYSKARTHNLIRISYCKVNAEKRKDHLFNDKRDEGIFSISPAYDEDIIRYII
jgi:tRNA U34 2-thiouridine synthase MnmA/TrmU